jgi:hypothetical protein
MQMQYKKTLFIVIALSALESGAQTGVLTPGGSTNSIAKFSASNTIVSSSSLVESGGNVGIGTSSPAYSLDVVGPIKSRLSTSGDASGITIGNDGSQEGKIDFTASDNSARFKIRVNDLNQPTERLGFYAGPLNNTALSESFVIAGTGYLGVGVINPSYRLEVVGAVKARLDSANATGIVIGNDGNQHAKLEFTASDNSARFKIRVNDLNQATERLSFYAGPLGNIATTEALVLGGNGNVGVGTVSPSYKFDVAGQMRAQGGIVFPDGNTQSVAWTGSLCGGDYAESIDVTDDRKKYEPGDVLVIDPNVDGKFVKSSQPYSTSVAGIYSTKPGVVGRRQTTEKNPDEIPMAVIGIVPVKVSTENGPIHRGDILVTSSTPGYAMKGTDRSQMFQAVIGKAMASLESGSGVIEILVSLQ